MTKQWKVDKISNGYLIIIWEAGKPETQTFCRTADEVINVLSQTIIDMRGTL